MGLEERKLIITCDCSSVPNFAKAQLRIRVLKNPLPLLYTKKRFASLLSRLPQNTEVSNFVQQYRIKKGRFAFYLEWDSSGKLTQVLNLLTGRPIK